MHSPKEPNTSSLAKKISPCTLHFQYHSTSANCPLGDKQNTSEYMVLQVFTRFGIYISLFLRWCACFLTKNYEIKMNVCLNVLTFFTFAFNNVSMQNAHDNFNFVMIITMALAMGRLGQLSERLQFGFRKWFFNCTFPFPKATQS